MSKKLTTEQFIEKAKLIHGDKYDYSKVNYLNSRSKVIIICMLHEDFSVTPDNHLRNKSGCPKCSGKCNGSTSEFIIKAEKVHSLEYDYSLVDYKNGRTKISIVCKKHGKFRQIPENHLQKQGCPVCRYNKISIKMGNNPTGWSYSNWIKAAEKSKNFDSFKVYIIRCWNEDEEFYKIGKTFTTVEKRFNRAVKMPYSYEIIKITEGKAKEMSILEKQLQKDNKNNKYKPKIKFGGEYECFPKLY